MVITDLPLLLSDVSRFQGHLGSDEDSVSTFHFNLGKTRPLKQMTFKCAYPVSVDPIDRNEGSRSVVHSTVSAEEIQRRKKT